MKTIFDNAGYKAANAQLNQLTEAHNAAKLEESDLLAQMFTQEPPAKQSALGRAMLLLSGSTQPTRRTDSDGLRARLDACRETLALLVLAISEQREIMAGLVGAQSAVVNIERKADHIKAATGIQTALAGLRDAMQVEQSLRAEITAAGYRCSLDPITHPELIFEDSNSTIAGFTVYVEAYLVVQALSAVKAVNVRLLCSRGDGLPGDVRLDGDGWTLYAPIVTSIVLSVGLTLMLAIVSRIRRGR